MASSRKLPRNFGAYAAMEAFNILLLPGAALVIATPTAPAEWIALAFAIAASAGFLTVGARYWRSVHLRLSRGDRSSPVRALAFADSVERALMAITAAAAGALLYALVVHGLTAPVIAAALLTLLAGLEYVNYYHLQLQHFDNWSDFKRLLKGRVRQSHMAKELAAFRARTVSP